MITMAFSTSRFSVLKILNILVSFRFQEFLKLTDFAESGSVKDKLVWAFRIYDKDRSGFISVKEMVEMLQPLGPPLNRRISQFIVIVISI